MATAKKEAKTKKVIIRNMEDSGAKDFFVGFNGKTYLGQLNVEVELPEDVIKILKNTKYKVPKIKMIDGKTRIVGFEEKPRYVVEIA